MGLGVGFLHNKIKIPLLFPLVHAITPPPSEAEGQVSRVEKGGVTLRLMLSIVVGIPMRCGLPELEPIFLWTSEMSPLCHLPDPQVSASHVSQSPHVSVRQYPEPNFSVFYWSRTLILYNIVVSTSIVIGLVLGR